MSEWISKDEREELHKLLDNMIDNKECWGYMSYMVDFWDFRDFRIRRFELKLSLDEETIC